MKTHLTKTEKSANCNCEIPQPKGKCSENGIDVYCSNAVRVIVINKIYQN